MPGMTVDRESGQVEWIKHGDSSLGPPDHVSGFSAIVRAARVSWDYPLRVISLVMLFHIRSGLRLRQQRETQERTSDVGA